jgi:hypothetical protein
MAAVRWTSKADGCPSLMSSRHQDSRATTSGKEPAPEITGLENQFPLSTCVTTDFALAGSILPILARLPK